MKAITITIILFSLFLLAEQSRVTFKSITIRHMKQNDVGLIFDALLLNEATLPKETLDFEVRSRECCLLIDGVYECETQNVYGVNYLSLEPDKEVLVTLLWPTLIPYNRVGNCTMEIVTRHGVGTQIDDIKLIHFNTTINTRHLPDYMLVYFNDMKKAHGYTQCEHEDLNPFDSCRPVNCELKYFGARNFFQHPRCVAVPECENDPEVIYDYTSNACRHLRNILTPAELEEIKQGKFTNFIEASEVEDEKATVTHGERAKILRRVRRSLNESQTFADMLLSTAFFIMKIVVLMIFLYLMMAFLISVLFYLCIGCGVISTSVTMNTLERFE